jgi:hypothetical protein
MELFASACLIKKRTNLKVMTKSKLTGIDDPSLELTELLNTVTVTTGSGSEALRYLCGPMTLLRVHLM